MSRMSRSVTSQPASRARRAPASAVIVSALLLSCAVTAQAETPTQSAAEEPAPASAQAVPDAKPASATTTTGSRIARKDVAYEDQVWVGGVTVPGAVAPEAADDALPEMPLLDDDAR